MEPSPPVAIPRALRCMRAYQSVNFPTHADWNIDGYCTGDDIENPDFSNCLPGCPAGIAANALKLLRLIVKSNTFFCFHPPPPRKKKKTPPSPSSFPLPPSVCFIPHFANLHTRAPHVKFHRYRTLLPFSLPIGVGGGQCHTFQYPAMGKVFYDYSTHSGISNSRYITF